MSANGSDSSAIGLGGKRAACNLARVFHEICEGVLSDVKVINEVRTLSAEESFKADWASDGSTMVIGQLGRSPRVVTQSVPARIDYRQSPTGQRN